MPEKVAGVQMHEGTEMSRFMERGVPAAGLVYGGDARPMSMMYGSLRSMNGLPYSMSLFCSR
jgi:hypothetical protein